MALNAPTLKGRALRLLSAREHSRLELERKLASYEEEPGSLAAALDELQAKGFISEQRVLESVINRRAGKLGAARIKQELQNKGIAPKAVSHAMLQLRTTETERAADIWRRKFGSPPADAREHAKQIRFLVARGFGGDVIRRVIKGGADNLPDTD